MSRGRCLATADPNPFLQRLKSLLLLMTAGFSVLAVSVVSALGSSTQVFSKRVDAGLRWLIILATVLIVGTVFAFLFRLAAASGSGGRSLRKAAPGAFAVAIMWQGLQYAGTFFVARVLVNTSAMTKTFGLVLGLIGLIYIAAVMAVIGIQINVVLARKLYPRALLTPFTDSVDLTDADRRAYSSYARAQRHKGFETVEVTFAERVRTEETPEPEPVAQAGPEPLPQPGPAPQPEPEPQPEQPRDPVVP